MKTFDLLQETYWALLSNKARSGLTVLGIIIGIGSVIAMIAIGQGAQGSIQSSIQSLGANLIIVFPGAQRGAGVTVSAGRGSAQSLKLADAEALALLPEAKAVSAEVSTRSQVTAKGTNTNTSIVGVTPSYPEVRNVAVDTGAFFSDLQVKNSAKVAVIGPTVRDDLFGADADPIGQTIRIKGSEFKIIGMTKTKGGSGFNNQDDQLFIPITTAQRYLTGNEYVNQIAVQANDEASMTPLQESVTSLLLQRHNIADPSNADFSTMNQADIVAAAGAVTGTFTLLLGSVAGISLIVGGIGIMNMMLTTVTERTREIGLRKAIGAKKRDISLQFLAESVALTFLGGFLGILLGWLISWGVSKFGNIASSVSLSSVFLAFGVSAGIGVIFGWWPARRAASLNPIEALRYE